MKSKLIFTFAAVVILALGFLPGCSEDEEFKDVSVTPVEKLYEPENEKYTILQPSGSLFFEWSKAYAADNSIVYYEVLFDTPDGDFSDPLYIVASDNKGLSNGATITHKTINNIAAKAGIELGEEGVLKWTVRSNRGLNFEKAKESRTFTLIRLNSINGLEGAELFITGEGSEDGQRFKATDQIGVYEIFTSLEADQPYYFYSELGDTQRTFMVNEDQVSFKETYSIPEGATVAESGQYRITLDFESASAKVEQINSVEIFFCWTQAREAFTYTGGGVWQLENYNVQLVETSWGFDERYKFVFMVDGQEEHWGQGEPFFDGRPGIDREGYRDMAIVGSGTWDGPFKFPNELCDGDDLDRYFTDVTVSMTADKNYTHDFSNITE
ncbi:SusE domain-containing protein [Marinilabilia salmonicolor]|uniref:SusE domain-containing protein n=1 Tax=Marinilabilia salmonicolor TaxID=989 RepID=UPI00029B01FC|nr:SusE domain-containing protein [Marinilabilia salmonicolor]